jgi:hypothetical protein
MMNNVLVCSGTEGAVLVDSGFSTRAVSDLRKTVVRFSPLGVRFVDTLIPRAVAGLQKGALK